MEKQTVIELRGITKRFGKKVIANNNVSLDVKGGEILSVLGENGCGKTTLMNMLAGIYYPDEGTILIRGKTLVTGLTTAAGLWTTAAIGIAVGIGFFHGAVICTVVTLFAMACLIIKCLKMKLFHFRKSIKEIYRNIFLEIKIMDTML